MRPHLINRYNFAGILCRGLSRQSAKGFVGRGMLPDGFEETIRAEVAAQVATAIDHLEETGLPGREAPFRHVYANMPAHPSRRSMRPVYPTMSGSGPPNTGTTS